MHNLADVDAVTAGVIQASATVVAVLIGFGLSVFAERRAWKRRKQEQVRDRRIQTVMDLASLVTDVDAWLANLRAELDVAAQGINDPNLSAAGRSARLEGVRERLAPLVEEIQDMESRVAHGSTSLLLLSADGATQSLAASTWRKVSEVRQLVIAAHEDPGGYSSAAVQSLEAQLRDASRRFIEGAALALAHE